mgnify:CR=1 FL=1
MAEQDSGGHMPRRRVGTGRKVFGDWMGEVDWARLQQEPLRARALLRLAAEAMAEGRDTLFDIDWQGGQQIRNSSLGRDVVSIFVLPPSIAELDSRRTEAEAELAVAAALGAAQQLVLVRAPDGLGSALTFLTGTVYGADSVTLPVLVSR